MPAAAQLAAIGNISTSLVFLVPLPVLLGLCLTALFIYIHKQQKTQRIERLQKHSPDEALAGKGTQARANAFARRPWLETMAFPGKLLSILLQTARCQALPKTLIRPKFLYQPQLKPKQTNEIWWGKMECHCAFPDRTFEALKQTYHKRRHAVEQNIEEEKASDKAA
ncbi:hypothetical protein FOYG_00713 [Fusarium oxysporum NRRL 32931]|uniref:Uncharacterized protein n=1 Tax=Fusarium oxysporum NRRL 32931 TaxID=660029 RepID=W9J843_FUSOX|nr:hypothetical protein FOYG_00713 [Fusarium oxysporum NRRL 32931]